MDKANPVIVKVSPQSIPRLMIETNDGKAYRQKPTEVDQDCDLFRAHQLPY